jgi:hypothetical protein
MPALIVLLSNQLNNLAKGKITVKYFFYFQKREYEPLCWKRNMKVLYLYLSKVLVFHNR